MRILTALEQVAVWHVANAGDDSSPDVRFTFTRHDMPRWVEWRAHDMENPDHAVGTLIVSPSNEGPYIGSLSVHPYYQRQGIATKLWEAAGRPLHSPPWNRTPEGDAWARSVGGDTRHST